MAVGGLLTKIFNVENKKFTTISCKIYGRVQKEWREHTKPYP